MKRFLLAVICASLTGCSTTGYLNGIALDPNNFTGIVVIREVTGTVDPQTVRTDISIDVEGLHVYTKGNLEGLIIKYRSGNTQLIYVGKKEE